MFNIDTAEPEQPTLTIDTGTAPPTPPSDEVAKTRAYKAHMGLGDIVKQNYEEIYRNIADGQEDNLRKDASLEITNKAMQTQLQKLTTMAAEKGPTLTQADVQSTETTPVDPKSVIEQTYSRAYVNTLNDAAARNEDNVLDDAKANNPEAVAAYFNKGSDVLSKREYALTKTQNNAAAAEKNAWFGFKDPFFGDQHDFGSYDVKQLLSLGFYESAMLRGNTKDTSRLGFLGNVMDNQAKELLQLSFPEFQKEFDRIDDNLKKSDPILAAKFAQAVSGMSSSEIYTNNAAETLNVAMAAQGIYSIRQGLRMTAEKQLDINAGRASDRGGLVRGDDGVYRATASTPTSNTEVTVAGNNAQAQASKAVSDIVKSATAPNVTKATIAEGAGDVKEAAVQKAVQSVILRPDPIKDATDTLLSLHRGDVIDLTANPGNLSREEHTRLLDAAAGFDKNTVDILVNSTKVARTPLLAEEGFRSIADKIADYFPGRENTIMDINYRYDPVSNTGHFDTKIGNYGAVPFSSYELAAKHAEINGYPLNIEGKAGTKVYLPPAALKNLESVETTPAGTKFYVTHGIEVVPHANPQSGLVPYDLASNKFEKVLTDETAHIEQQGLGFHIVVSKPLNETEPFVRSSLIGAKKAQSVSNENTSRLTSAANAIIGLVRNPYDTLSKIENENRAKTVFGQTRFIELVKQEIKDVEDIYKGMLGDRNVVLEKPLSYVRTATGANRIVAQDFTRALEASQTLPDPKTALPGYYMKTPAEIQHFWETHFNRPATFKEQSAYLAVGRIDHFDHILRSVESYKFKSRLGAEQWTFNTSKDGVVTPSPTFEAVQLKRVPGNIDDVILIHEADGTERYFHRMGTNSQTEFRHDVEQGRFTGVEIFDPEKRPLNRLDAQGNNLRIRYVFSNAFERKPLSYDQMGYRGGGHWQYDYSHAVKQPIIRPQMVGGRFQHIYEGDTTHSFVANRAMGEQFATSMNEIARLIRAKDIKGAKAFAKTVFDQEWKDLYAGFRPSKNPVTGAITPPRFSTDPRQEFRVVPQGRAIKDLDDKLAMKYTKLNEKTQALKDTFVDGTTHGSLARNFQIEYSQPRESYAMTEPFNAGSPDKPFYQFRPAKLTDPITTMTRAVNRIINSSYMNDQKISSVEHWLEENKGLINASSNEIHGSPFHYFNEGKFRLTPDNALQVANAATNRYKIKQLVGMPSFFDTVAQGVKQSLSDGLYEMGRDTAVQKIDKKLGDTKLATVIKAPLVAPEWMLDRISNPVDFLRGMTFHFNLGLFAVKQVVVQSMAYTTIYGLAGPVKATQGSFAAWMHQWSRINKSPEIIAKMDQLATHFGWKIGEFTEAMKILDRTGFGHIGNEISLDNGLHKQTFFRNDLKGFLDLGQKPFNEGNLHVRFGAWYTAFKEFRDANPVKKIGTIEEGQIIWRANYLNTLMTRDANTVLNKGLIGVPFQFYDYMKKMADVFWSKNIGEDFKGENTFAKRSYIRARMFLLYAMLGGAAGATGVSGLPAGDIISKNAIEGDLPFQTEPYVPGTHLWSTLLMEGTVSTLLSGIIGHGDLQKGTFYNFNNRFNPNGLQVLKDAIQEDPKFWKILLGAMGSTVGNEIASLSGFTNAMYSMMEGNPAKEAWPLKVDDWIAPLKGIKSFSDFERLQYALAFGKWLDTHGRPVSDVSKIDAVFRTVTGLTDQAVDDKFIKDTSLKERTALYNKAGNEYAEQRRLAEQAAKNGDRKQANDYNKRAFFALTSRNVPLEQQAKFIARDATMNKDTIKQTDERYWLQYVPTDKQAAYLKAFQQTQKDNK